MFFGGFLVKSWWEERVFERDTRRLLAYYKHVLPGSMLDGDFQNARYVVYKYRNKKERLWRGLEKKYDVPVFLEHEWEDWNGDEEDGVWHPMIASDDPSTVHFITHIMVKDQVCFNTCLSYLNWMIYNCTTYL